MQRGVGGQMQLDVEGKVEVEVELEVGSKSRV